MLVGPLLFALLISHPVLVAEDGWKFGLIWLNNLHHMTIERATTPHVEKRLRVLDAETDAPVAGARVVVVHNLRLADDWIVAGTTAAATGSHESGSHETTCT